MIQMICMIRYFDYLFEQAISILEIKMYQKMHKSNGSARNVIWNLLYMYHLEFRRPEVDMEISIYILKY